MKVKSELNKRIESMTNEELMNFYVQQNAAILNNKKIDTHLQEKILEFDASVKIAELQYTKTTKNQPDYHNPDGTINLEKLADLDVLDQEV